MKNLLPSERTERKILVKKEAITDKKYGKSQEERSMQELLQNGVICLNKPEGPSSHEVADYVKRILNMGKVGHGGTLDPKVTGVLPIALNKATRMMEYLLKGGKEYVCLMRMHKLPPPSMIEESMKKFVGKIMQLPPVRSAVKRQRREREIYYLDVLEIDGRDVLFVMGCQAGTYVRKFVFDFGKQLGIGAHMAQLIRTKAGPFTDKEWYSLHDLQDAFYLFKEKNDETILRKIIKPVEFAARHLPKVWVLDSTVDTLCHGANLSVPGIAKLNSDIKTKDGIAVFTLKNELVAIGQALMTSEEIMENEKGLAVKPEKVFLDPEVYPHFKPKLL
ncbi:MAG TPA: RNA-guided pseudouridylation complex pseudouridine synthase subunit Cbf5 [Candidatus Nanoarchaeia archaeon]|nr:RNA-guided pseudouridylation complex pseudouridine synthase subunit Cbf5 [Candidatus Nanoarchaeia archaeon]